MCRVKSDNSDKIILIGSRSEQIMDRIKLNNEYRWIDKCHMGVIDVLYI